MKKLILLSILVVSASLSLPAQTEGIIYLDVDDASHLVLTQNNAIRTLANGNNTIDYKTWQTLSLSPAEGYKIESFASFDTDGNPTSTIWWYDAVSDTYSTQFSSYKYDGYTFKVSTTAYSPEMSSIEITISDADAIKNGTFTIGNTTVEAVSGTREISFDPQKGNMLTLTLTRNVENASLTLNDKIQQPEENAFGESFYSVALASGDKINLSTQFENPVFNLDIDNPAHVDITFPDTEHILTNLVEGNNQLNYAIGDVLTVKAADGWKITRYDGLRYSSYTDTYSYTFKGGESGMNIIIETEEYTPPVAEFIIDIEKPELISRIVADVVTTKFDEGRNIIKVNLEKEDYLQIVYKISNAAEIEATLDGEPLPVEESWIYSSTIDNLEPKTYHLTIGTPGWIPEQVGMEYNRVNHDTVNIYTIDGYPVKLNADKAAIRFPGPGLYIVNGKKVLIKQ